MGQRGRLRLQLENAIRARRHAAAVCDCGRLCRVNKRVVARSRDGASGQIVRPSLSLPPLFARLTAAAMPLPIVVGVFLDYVPRHLAAPIERPADADRGSDAERTGCCNMVAAARCLACGDGGGGDYGRRRRRCIIASSSEAGGGRAEVMVICSVGKPPCLQPLLFLLLLLRSSSTTRRRRCW